MKRILSLYYHLVLGPFWSPTDIAPSATPDVRQGSASEINPPRTDGFNKAPYDKGWECDESPFRSVAEAEGKSTHV